jgi:hypothetical protein
LNDGRIANVRVVRVHVSTRYNRGQGNRRASRNNPVSDLPPETPHVTIRHFCTAVSQRPSSSESRSYHGTQKRTHERGAGGGGHLARACVHPPAQSPISCLYLNLAPGSSWSWFRCLVKIGPDAGDWLPLAQIPLVTIPSAPSTELTRIHHAAEQRGEHRGQHGGVRVHAQRVQHGVRQRRGLRDVRRQRRHVREAVQRCGVAAMCNVRFLPRPGCPYRFQLQSNLVWGSTKPLSNFDLRINNKTEPPATWGGWQGPSTQ